LKFRYLCPSFHAADDGWLYGHSHERSFCAGLSGCALPHVLVRDYVRGIIGTKAAGGDCASLRPVVRLLFVISFFPFYQPFCCCCTWSRWFVLLFGLIAVYCAYVGWLGRWPLWELTTA
jgi:hypothetical protein